MAVNEITWLDMWTHVHVCKNLKLKGSYVEDLLFYFFGHATQLAGSSLSDQGLNLGPWQWKQSPNHWPIREFSLVLFIITACTKMTVSVMMNFSSGNTHVIVFSLEIYFHIKNRKSEQCYHLKPSNYLLQSSYLHFIYIFTAIYYTNL